jgi:tetratricopeptide (TPR) repeat protein
MANNLSVALSQIGRHQAALEVLEGTYLLFTELDELSKAAQALGNQAAAYEGLHQWVQAEALYLQAAERFQSLGEEENRRYTLQALSRIRLRLGRPMEAVSTMQGALEGSKSGWRDRLIRKILALPGRILKP